jgi:type II secretory pathway component GspD/PulD (secretin)
LLVGDPSINQLSVSGPPEHLEAIRELLAIVDQRPRQVYISTVIGQLTLGDDIEYGVDMVRTIEGFEVGDDASRFAGALRNRTADILDPAELGSIAEFLPAATGLNIYGQIGDQLNVFISALERTQRFKVLSRPSIFALNNRRAVIATGQRIAVPTSTLTRLDGGVGGEGAVTANIDYRDVVLKLEVVALINSDSEVTLTISQVNDEVIGSSTVSGNEVPTIGTQEMVTSVIVPNGRTVMLGGLVTETMEDTRSGIPILIHIPILKHLFGSTDQKQQRKELVIFLQPHIINDEDTLGLGSGDMRMRSQISAESEDSVAARFLPVDALPEAAPAREYGGLPEAGAGGGESGVQKIKPASGHRPYFRGSGGRSFLPGRR